MSEDLDRVERQYRTLIEINKDEVASSSANKIAEPWEKEAALWGPKRDDHALLGDSLNRSSKIKYLMLDWEERLKQSLSKQDSKGLELGGAGSSGLYLPKDILSQMVVCDIASTALSNNQITDRVRTDARAQLPFKDQSFALITSFFLPRYIPNHQGLFLEVDRVLKPGGRFFIMDYTLFGHANEVTEFDPQKIKQLLIFNHYSQVEIIEVSPEISSNTDSTENGKPVKYQYDYRGPLLLFTGVKNSNV